MIITCAKLFLNPTMHNKVMGRTQTGFTEVYAQCLSADCDLDLLPSDMVHATDTLSCHDNHLCQIIFKSYHVRLSYGPDMILEQREREREREERLYALPAFYGGGKQTEYFREKACVNAYADCVYVNK